MDDLDETYKVLKRTPFAQVVEMCYNFDPHGTYTFHQLNIQNKWRVSNRLRLLVEEQGWNIEDFNNQVDKHFRRNYGE